MPSVGRQSKTILVALLLSLAAAAQTPHRQRGFVTRVYSVPPGSSGLIRWVQCSQPGLNETWDYMEPASSLRQTPTTPSGRWSASMDFDPVSRGMVLFGGELTGDPFEPAARRGRKGVSSDC